MSEPLRWVPIESNPDVMNALLAAMGVSREWSVVDVIGVEPELLAFIPRPVAALILLFPLTARDTDHTTGEQSSDDSCGQQSSEECVESGVYFMRQTIGNACGTIALIHAIANNRHQISLASNSSIASFLESSESLSPLERGKLLEQNADICEAHQLYAQCGQTATPTTEHQIDYHFIAFVEKDGSLYRLDGRKSCADNLGPTTKDTFLSDAAVVCQQYMSKDPNNLNFTIVALVKQN